MDFQVFYLNLNAFIEAVGNHSHSPGYTGIAQNLPDIQEKYKPLQQNQAYWSARQTNTFPMHSIITDQMKLINTNKSSPLLYSKSCHEQ